MLTLLFSEGRFFGITIIVMRVIIIIIHEVVCRWLLPLQELLILGIIGGSVHGGRAVAEIIIELFTVVHETP